MAYDWKDFSHQEKQYFQNNEGLFQQKKAALFEISEITNKINSLHAKAKLLPEGDDLQSIAETLVELDTKRVELFKEIDQWQQ